jgi:hypothetical protein
LDIVTMFHFIPPVDYQARMAEAQFLRAEAARREEDALRARLGQIQLEKLGSPAPGHNAAYPLTNYYSHYPTYPQYPNYGLFQSHVGVPTDEDLRRASAIEEAKRVLADEEAKARKRIAEEQELRELVNRIALLKEERSNAERRHDRVRRCIEALYTTEHVQRADVANSLISAIGNQTSSPKNAQCGGPVRVAFSMPTPASAKVSRD